MYSGHGLPDMNITEAELHEIVWNQPDNRLDDLIAQTCQLWERSFNHRLKQMKRENDLVELSEEETRYMARLSRIMKVYGGFTRRCIDESRLYPHAHSSRVAPVMAVHHLKGPVVAANAEDAGVDILNFTQRSIHKLGHAVSFYTSAHLDLLGTVLKLIDNIGAFAGAGGYSFNLMGEYEVVSGDSFTGGMNHYSNWTTVKMGLQFAEPKYCLTLRLDPFYLYGLMGSVQDEFDQLRALDNPRSDHSQMYDAFLRFLKLFEHDISYGYLICTQQQPPGFDRGELVKSTHYPVHQDATTIGMEYYRFAGPRFNSDAIYDTTKEAFRDWVYPLRGQSDYLKFIHSMTDLSQNEVNSMSNYANAFEWSSQLVTWFMRDKQVTEVDRHFRPAAREYVKFPKRYVYSRFSAVPPAIGGFYNY